MSKPDQSKATGHFPEPGPPRTPGGSPGQPASHGDKNNGASRKNNRRWKRWAAKLRRRFGKKASEEE